MTTTMATALGPERTDTAGRQDGVAGRIARNMLSRSARQVVNGVVGFVLVPLFVRHLGAAAYGIWVLAQSMVQYLNMLELGLTTTLTRHVAAARGTGDYGEANRVLGQLSLILWGLAGLVAAATVGGVFVLPGCLALAPAQVSLFQAAFLMIGTQAAMGLGMKVWDSLIAAEEDYHVLNGVYIVGTVARFGYSVVLLRSGHGLLSLLGAQFAVLGAMWVAVVWFVHRRYPRLRLRPAWYGWSEAKSLLTFSTAVLLGQAGGLLATETDKVIAGAVLGPVAVAVYQVGYRLYSVAVDTLASPINVLLPTAAGMAARGEQDRLRRLLSHCNAVMVGLLGAAYVPLLLYGGAIVHLWVGPRFAASARVLAYLSAGVLVTVHNWPMSAVLWGMSDYWVVVWITVACAVLKVVLSAVLCVRHGVVGIAAGMPLAAVPLQVVYTAYALRRFHIGLWAYAGRAWLGAAAGGFGGWCLVQVLCGRETPDSWAGVCFRLGAFQVGYWACMWLLGFSAATRQHLVAIVLRKGSRPAKAELPAR